MDLVALPVNASFDLNNSYTAEGAFAYLGITSGSRSVQSVMKIDLSAK